MTTKRKSFLSVIGLLAVFAMVFIGCGQATGSEQADTYIVTYSANGGTGSMSNSVFTIDVPGTLRPNAFAWQGHTFSCWTANSNGSGTQYQNGQQVLNLADAGQTKTLYAKWDETLDANAGEFIDAIESISSTPGAYTINLTGNLPNYEGISLSTAGVEITVKGDGLSIISWKQTPEGPSSLFSVGAGASLTLENIELRRSAENTEGGELIHVEGGTLEIKDGVTISNKANNTTFYNGIYINGGTFTMTGGTVENCKNGVTIDGDGTLVTFTDAKIKDNAEHGIRLDGTNCNLAISNTILSGNCFSDSATEDISYNGINVVGTGNNITITGGKITGVNNYDSGFRLAGTGHTATLSDVEISAHQFMGILTGGDSTKCILTISNSIIKNNNNHGIDIRGSWNSVTVNGGKITNNVYHGIRTRDISSNINLTVSNVTISGNSDGIRINGTSNSVTLSSGTISNNNNGINIQDTKNSFTLVGGNISGNNGNGIGLNGTDNSVTLNGGTIGNNYNGISINGTKNKFTMGEASISGNNDTGIGLWGTECIVTINGGAISDSKNYDGINLDGTGNSVIMTKGAISGNKGNGVALSPMGSKNSFTMSGGTISNTKTCSGISISGTENSVTIKGGTISGNKDWGVGLWNSAGSSFKKETGGVITGNSDENPNQTGAVNIGHNIGSLLRWSTVPEGEAIEAAINADGTLGDTDGDWTK